MTRREGPAIAICTRPSKGRLLRLAAVALLSSCGARSGLLGLEEGDGGGFGLPSSEGGSAEGAAGLVDVADATVGLADAIQTTSPHPYSSESPDTAVAQDDACAMSILSYQAPATFAGCWSCASNACSSQLKACAADCTCDDAIARALACVDEGGGIASCFLSAFNSAGDSTQSAAQECLMMAYGQCTCPASSNQGSPATVDAAPPPAVDDGGACMPMGGGGDEGSGECNQNWSEMCGSTNYQIDCACPRGTCICFGPTTNVVSYPGCPYCPSEPAVGPTTLAQVFALCGFPYPQ
jgi:hypothetical protein